MIRLLIRILALFGWMVPGYSRDGPLCNNVEFAGVLFKPVIVPKAGQSAEVWTLFARAKLE